MPRPRFLADGLQIQNPSHQAPSFGPPPPAAAPASPAEATLASTGLSQRRGLTAPSVLDTPPRPATGAPNAPLKSPAAPLTGGSQGEDLLEASFGGSEVPSELDMSTSYGAVDGDTNLAPGPRPAA